MTEAERFETGMLAFERVARTLPWPPLWRLLLRPSALVPASELWMLNGQRVERIVNLGTPAEEA